MNIILDCGQLLWLYFENIYHGDESEKKFDNLKPYLNDFLSGKSVCIFNHGVTGIKLHEFSNRVFIFSPQFYFFITGSGKTHTMFGTETNHGLLSRSINYILKTKALTVSCVELVGRDYFELIDKRAKIEKALAKKIVIHSGDKFQILVSNILKLRLQKTTDQNRTSSRSHLFFNFEDEFGSKLTFIDLAGWESPKNKTDIKETKFINASLTSLNTALEKIATNYTPSYDTELTKAFKPLLRGSICMLYHVSNNGVIDGLKNIKNIVASNKGKQQFHLKTPLQNITNSIRI